VRGRQLGRLGLLSLAAAVSACAAASPTPPSPAAPAPPASPPAAPARSPAAALAADHRHRADQLEHAGDLRRALDEWKIALTIDPGDAVARARRKALEGQIEETVATRVRQGREALARGAHLEARRHFLAVLAADPTNRPAFEALRSEVKEVRFVLHTVRRGETLAGLAERYYGDRSRGEVIGETNQLAPNARLTAGAVVKIPEIPGVPFAAPELRPPPAVVETPEANPLLAEAREALERGDFAVALADVELVLGSSPQSVEGLDLKKAILYGLGKAQFEQRNYGESYQTLTQLARLAPGYQDAPVLLRQARDRLVQQYYNQGLRLYREEKLEEAIAAWRVALELDPNHVNVRRNLEQAERVLRGLQQRRRATPPAQPK
jgi:tetratricopeptide (TPR) repeat protein